MKRNRVALLPEESIGFAEEEKDRIDIEGLRIALESMALEKWAGPPLNTESSEWAQAPEVVPVVAFTQGNGPFQFHNVIWSKTKVQELCKDFMAKNLSYVKTEHLPSKVQEDLKYYDEWLALRTTPEPHIFQALDQLLKEGGDVDSFIGSLTLPEITTLAAWVQFKEPSKVLQEAVAAHVPPSKKARGDQEQAAAQEGQMSGGGEQGQDEADLSHGASGSVAPAAAEEEEAVDLLAKLVERVPAEGAPVEDDRSTLVPLTSSEGVALGQCRHIVNSTANERTALLLCKEAGISKLHLCGTVDLIELANKLHISLKPKVRPYNSGLPVTGAEKDHYEPTIKHVEDECRNKRAVPVILNIAGHKTALSVLVASEPVPTFVSGGADLSFLTGPSSNNLKVDLQKSAVTADSKISDTADDMLPQLTLEHFGGTAASSFPHLTIGGDFATVLHLLVTRTEERGGAPSISLDYYKNIDVSFAMAFTLGWISKARNRDLPAEYLRGAESLRSLCTPCSQKDLSMHYPSG